MDQVNVTENSDGTYQVFIHNARLYDGYITSAGSPQDKVIFTVPDYGMWAELTFADNAGEYGYVDVTLNGSVIKIADPIWRQIIEGFDPFVMETLGESRKMRMVANAH